MTKLDFPAFRRAGQDLDHCCDQKNPLGRLFRIREGSHFLMDDSNDGRDNEMKSQCGHYYIKRERVLPFDKIHTYHYGYVKSKERIKYREQQYQTYYPIEWCAQKEWVKNVFLNMNVDNARDMGSKYGFDMHRNLCNFRRFSGTHPLKGKSLLSQMSCT